VVVLENAKITQVLGKGNYLDYLANHFAQATNFYAVCHPSSPNYLSMTNGRSLQCGTDNHTVYSQQNIANELTKKGHSWMAYSESMPKACDLSNVGEYVVRHDPFLSYADIVNNATLCDQHIVNSSAFNSSVASGRLNSFSFYTPNLYDDGHTPASVSDASKWLQGFLSPILNHTGRYSSSAERSLVNHTAFIVLFDESDTNDVTGYSAGGTTIAGGHVFLTVVSSYSKGLKYTANATDYNLESTVEWLFNTTGDGGHDGTAAFPSMSSLFDFSSNGY